MKKIESTLRPYFPIDLIDVTLKRITEKTEKRHNLIDFIKKIQKEANLRVEKLLKMSQEGP